MQELNGYIKLYRKLIKWGWYQDNAVKSLFLHFLLTASFKDFEWMGKNLKAGQLITGRKKLAEELKFSERQIRTAMEKLKSTGEVTYESTNKYTIVTVVNWEDYQSNEEASTNERPTEKAVFCEQMINKLKNLKNSTNETATKKDLETLLSSGISELETFLKTNISANERPTSDQQATNKRPHRKNNKNVKNEKKYNTRTREGSYSNGYAGVKNLADD